MSHRYGGNTQILPKTKLCEVCSASFTRTTHLNRHLRSHTNQRRFECDLCLSKFTRSDLLARHRKTCGVPKQPAPSRRKSCQECARSKIKCDLQEPCSKCVERGRQCIYVNDPKKTPSRTGASVSITSSPNESPTLPAPPLPEDESSTSVRSPVPTALPQPPVAMDQWHPHTEPQGLSPPNASSAHRAMTDTLPSPGTLAEYPTVQAVLSGIPTSEQDPFAAQFAAFQEVLASPEAHFLSAAELDAFISEYMGPCPHWDERSPPRAPPHPNTFGYSLSTEFNTLSQPPSTFTVPHGVTSSQMATHPHGAQEQVPLLFDQVHAHLNLPYGQ